ncbi:MAG: murein L,D-transpeptidase catalytic domain-containing protein [Ferruginibacter sp.]
MSTIKSIRLPRKAFVLAMGLLLTVSGFSFWHNPIFGSRQGSLFLSLLANKEISRIETLYRLQEKASLVKDYINQQGYNTEYCFFIDMRIPSGKNRFFVYDLKADSIKIAGLVAHGKGSDMGSPDALIFSNEPNSYCTSLGKYKIGRSYSGIFGLSYKLQGLEKTNSRAFDRSVVLHSFCGVPNKEVYPVSICKSEGCPTVAPAFLVQLKTYMDNSGKPILLWIYY